MRLTPELRIWLHKPLDLAEVLDGAVRAVDAWPWIAGDWHELEGVVVKGRRRRSTGTADHRTIEPPKSVASKSWFQRLGGSSASAASLRCGPT